MATLLSDEQELVQDAARDALGRVASLERVRAALDGAELADLWEIAVDTGWTGLLVAEHNDGAGLGAAEAALVMTELGRTLARVPLLGHLVATGLLQRVGDPEGLLVPLARGERRASVVFPDASVELNGGAVTGSVEWAIDAEDADLLVVAAAEGRIVVLEAAGKGISTEGHRSFDPSLNLARVAMDFARGKVLEAEADDCEWARLLAQVLLAASLTGTGRVALELGVDYARERHAFARPIGSFQAIKHGLVEVLRHLEIAEVLIRDAAGRADGPVAELRAPALAARLAAGRAVNVATRTCMAVHGGIGVTWEHDAPVLFRRAQLGRRLLGGDERVADQLAGALLSAY